MKHWEIEVLIIIALMFSTPFMIFWYASSAEDREMPEMFFWAGVFWATVYFVAKWWFSV